MATVSEIKGKLDKFFPSTSPDIEKTLLDFSRKNVNSSGQELDTKIIEFVASLLEASLPIGWRQKTYEHTSSLLLGRSLPTHDASKGQKGVPGFILENIKTMPSNKGYMWQRIEYRGQLPPLSINVVLFEPRRGRTFIHVRTPTYIEIYERVKGQRSQTLLSREEIKKDETKSPEKTKPPAGGYELLYLSSDSDSDT